MTGIVLQARMGSTRLPGKIMKKICGREMLGHILDRLKRVRNADILVVATSVHSRDDEVAAFAEAENAAWFRGEEQDVLDRYYKAALHFGLDTIVRATADNPLLDPEEIERLIDLHKAETPDFSMALNLLPVGVGAECFSLAGLRRSWEEGRLPHHREHVDEYALENPLLFRTCELLIDSRKRAPQLRLTVDTEEDFAVASHIYETLYGKGDYIRTEEVIELCASSSA